MICTTDKQSSTRTIGAFIYCQTLRHQLYHTITSSLRLISDHGHRSLVLLRGRYRYCVLSLRHSYRTQLAGEWTQADQLYGKYRKEEKQTET